MGWGDAPRVGDWEADLADVYERLRAHGVRYTAVYTSFLERARQTGMFFARKRNIPILYDTPSLNEINYGQLFRKSKSWVEENFPQHKRDPDFVYPGGESFTQMQARSVGFMELLTRKRSGETVLVVVHAGIIRGFVSHFLGLTYADHLRHRIGHRYIGDFLFEGERCVRYDELGELSGFVCDQVISVPFECDRQVNAS